MDNIKISTQKSDVTPEEVINLWITLGWGTAEDYKKLSIQTALDNTSMIVSARDDNKNLIGLARILSDGVIHATLIDIVVHPNFQKQGVGKKLMEEIKKKNLNIGIYMEAFKENEKFFEKCGYKKRDYMSVYSRKF